MTPSKMLFALASISLVLAGAPLAAQSFIEAHEGTLPIILEVPHDGTLKPDHLQERTGVQVKSFNTSRDTHTAELAREVAAFLQKKSGKSPYVVINLLHRKYMDANRSEKDGAETPEVKAIHTEYFDQIRSYVSTIREGGQMGLLIDIHRWGNAPHDLLPGTRKHKSFPNLFKKYGQEVYTGQNSLGYSLSSSGFEIPGFNGVADHPGLSGTVVAYFSKSFTPSMDAVQFEVRKNNLDSKANRAKLAEAIADAILVFYEAFLK